MSNTIFPVGSCGNRMMSYMYACVDTVYVCENPCAFYREQINEYKPKENGKMKKKDRDRNIYGDHL